MAALGFRYILPPRVGVLSMWASVATGIPFQLGAPFQAVESSSSHHAGQCDPHIRPNPADAYWIGADGMEIEISFWCTQNTGLDVARFDATFLDSNEYLTTTFAFRKVSAAVAWMSFRQRSAGWAGCAMSVWLSVVTVRCLCWLEWG